MASIDRIYVAEKPSLAETIAVARAEMLGVRASKSGGAWHVGDTEKVTWFFGHM